MNLLILTGEILFLLLLFFILLFACYNWFEQERRALWRSLFIAVVLLIVGGLIEFVLPSLKGIFFSSVFVIGVFVFLWLLLSGKPQKALEILNPPQKIDERDVIFSRFDLRPDSIHWEQYYSARKKLKNIDNSIRQKPDILTPEHWKRSPVLFSLAEAEFDFLEHQLTAVDGAADISAWTGSPAANTRMLKNILHLLGAELCGVCHVDPSYIYSHVGRGPELWGSEITNSHSFAVPFVLEMEPRMIASAPHAPVIVETAKQYVDAARISIIAARMLRRLGYSARAHIAGSNYQAMLTPLAWLAGLGELGRMGMLITKKYGPRIRLGLLTTDLPLLPDQPQVFGVQEFCATCRKCAVNCPSQAIPEGEKIAENGVLKWVIDREECYRFWRLSGTDCARCISVCPYSKPDNFLHKVIRRSIEASKAAQLISVYGDDLFYGRKPAPRESPSELQF